MKETGRKRESTKEKDVKTTPRFLQHVVFGV